MNINNEQVTYFIAAVLILSIIVAETYRFKKLIIKHRYSKFPRLNVFLELLFLI
jgi:hypothetical protein